MKGETRFLRMKHIHPQQIRGQHVIGELHPLVSQPQHRGQACCQSGFADTGYVFE